jgi:hypothetical protein
MANTVPVIINDEGQAVEAVPFYLAGALNGADPAKGATGDAAYGDNTGAAGGSLVALLKGLFVARQKKPSATARIPSAAASTNPTSVKATPGDVILITGYNAAAAGRWLKLYDKIAAPVVGTDVPVWTEYLPPTAKFSIAFGGGLPFAAGIALALTTGPADGDVGALAAADVLGLNIAYA